MGLVYAEILLTNGKDLDLAEKHIIGQEEVKHITVNMLVNSGAYMMCINESIQVILDLPFVEKERYAMANGTTVDLDIVGPLNMTFRHRITRCNAVVLPGDSEPLPGAIPMEEIDVLIHPLRQELILNPGNSGVHL